jgi:hypothetical protein
MRTSFPQDHGEVPASETESLLNSSCDCDFGLVAGNAEFVAVNPKPPGAVVDFECSDSHNVERIYHLACNRDFVIVKARGITINRFDAFPRGAGSENCCRGDQTADGYESGNFGQGSSRMIGLLKHRQEMEVVGG